MTTARGRLRERLRRAVLLSYQIRRVVNNGKQPSRKDVKYLVRLLSVSVENTPAIIAAGPPTRGDDDDIVLGESLASALGTLAAAGWRTQKISRQDAKRISEALVEAYEAL